MKFKFTCLILFGFLFQPGFLAMAQEKNTAVDSTYQNGLKYFEVGNFPKTAATALKQFSVNGYYRFVSNYRHLNQAYAHLENNKNNIFVGDDSQIPQLMLNMSGSVAKNTTFGTDLYMWTPMTGLGTTENVKGLNLGISLYGNFTSSLGDFNVRTGGINWYSLTPFTFQSNKGYNRYSIFERNPWDPNTKNMDSRYADFYNSGSINQDERWGQQAFQGMILEASRLPKGFSGVMMYGKTQLNGGLSPLPNNSIGGKIKKEYGSNYISANTFNNVSYTDTLQQTRIGFNVATLEFRNKIKRILLKGELGMGRAFVQEKSNGWGEALSLKISGDLFKKYPLEMHLFRISSKVVNNSSSFINTSFEQTQILTANTSTQPVLPAVASTMAPIGQLVNNRQGVDLNAQVNIGKIKTAIGYNVSAEIENLSSKITYAHPVNSLVLAHFWRWDFPSNVGPYNNLSKIYRNVYETVNLTSIDATTGLPLKKKYFNSVEINSKYHGSMGAHDFYIYYLGQFSSAQNNLAPLTIFTEKALLRTYYHQLETYFGISNNFIWCNYAGFERIIANYETQTDVVSRRPKNQTGISIATGFDIRLSKGAGLYLRQRWMNSYDSSFSKDKYSGYETTAEIKIFF